MISKVELDREALAAFCRKWRPGGTLSVPLFLGM